MNNKKLSVIIVVILLLAVVLVFNTSNISKTSNIRIGVVYALSGPAAVWSENGKHAAEMAVEEINSAGGVDGKKIELVVEDSKTDPKSSVSAFQKLVSIDRVNVVIGDVWSFITNPLIPLAESSKTVLISPTVMNHSVEKQSPYFFTVGHTVESQEAAMEKFFTSNPDVQTVYELCWNDDWGNAHSPLLQKVAAKIGVKVIGRSCTADFTTDYHTEALKIKALNPDAVFLTSVFEQKAIKALVDLKVPTKILTTTGIVEAVRVESFPVDYVKKVWFMDWAPNQAFIDAFYKKYGTYPIMEAQNSYEAIQSIARALKNNPTHLLAGLKSVNYQTTDGEIDFTGHDNITVNKSQAKLYKINDDKSFVEVK